MSSKQFPMTIPQVLAQTVQVYPKHSAQLSKNSSGTFVPTTFTELQEEAITFAGGLKSLGVQKGDALGLIADNRKEWLVADLAITGIGAADVPRGRDTLPQELAYILDKPSCKIVLAENQEQAAKVIGIVSQVPAMTTLIVLDQDDPLPPAPEQRPGLIILGYQDVMAKGQTYRAQNPDFWAQSTAAIEPDDVATIIFTSGTTGEPKGVILTHRNFCHQLAQVHKVIDIKPGDIFLSVLPVWHSFERVVQYICISTAASLAYSKPIGKIMLQDFIGVRPMWMASVPRIWETIKAGVYKNATEHGGIKAALFYAFVNIGGAWSHLRAMFRGLVPQFKKRSVILDRIISCIPLVLLTPLKALGDILVFSKVKAKLGGRFKAGISGGGSLPDDIDSFFGAAGITLLNGYGLTETAPVIAIRNWFRPVAHTLAPLPETQIRIVDDQGRDCPPGVRGLIMVKGDQVMKGYYKNPLATSKVLSSDGWLNTGDLGVWTHEGNFAIRGRAKDTIVLMGGENIEPGPIEAKLRESEFIEQAMVVGQDKKFLGALVQIDLKAMEVYLKANNIPYIARSSLAAMPEVKELINEEITLRINGKAGFRPFERIGRFAIIEKPFEIGVELSAKQEIKRHVITEMYHKEIEAIFKS